MRIIEIKSQTVKISYKPSEDKLSVGDFLDFNEGATGLVAQIFRIFSDDSSGEYNQAELTFLLTVKYGKAYKWNGEIVSAEAKVKKTSCEFIENYINGGDFTDVFALGYCAGAYNRPLRLSFSKFKTPAFVGYEKQTDNIAFLSALSHQVLYCAKKLLVIDYNGNIEIEGAARVTAGFQMKLPLNGDMLENLTSKMTLGVSADAKAVIEEVLVDLAGFARQTSDFISIKKLINVVDETYKKSKISQLILFKNKLRAYQRQNIFADNFSETLAVQDAICEHNTVIFDISNVPAEWRNAFLNRALMSKENKLKDYYLYLPIEQDIDNKLLNYLLFKSVKDGIRPILAANYRYVAMDKVLDFSANSFLFNSSNALNKREYLSDIIQSLPQDYFVILGDLTSSLPVTSYLGEPIEVFDEAGISEINRENNETLDIVQDNIDVNSFEEPQQEVQIQEAAVDMQAINTALDTAQEEEISEPEQNTEQVITEDKEEDPDALSKEEQQEVIDVNFEENPEITLLPEETDVPDVAKQAVSDEIAEPEFAEDELFDDDKFVHMDVLDSNYNMGQQAHEAAPVPASTSEVEDIAPDDLDFLEDVQPDEQPYTQNDEDELLDLLSETEDADGVEDINVDELDFDEPEAAQPEPQETPAQKLPIYDAQYDKTPKQESINLHEGDLVKHNKYGLGTVKKLINHGNKVMCFINFEDFGRRLLDPEISQLEKIQ